MKTIIFMSHRIKQRNPDGPVIRAVMGSNVVEANCLRLFLNGAEIGKVVYDPQNSPVDSHDVKAWVEFNEGVSVQL